MYLQVSIEQRNHAKRIAYGLLYGMGPAALGTELGISMGAAKELMDDFQQKHPKLDAWLKASAGICLVSSHASMQVGIGTSLLVTSTHTVKYRLIRSCIVW